MALWKPLLVSQLLFQLVDAADLLGITVDPESGHYVDRQGRVRIFHGVNVVYKESPWYPRSDRFSAQDSLDPETMKQLQQWGFNVVRLGVMWPGVEPEPNQIDYTYLEAVGNLTRSLGQHGIYTVADLHQDLGSRRFCGEGFPEARVEALLRDPASALAKAPAFPAPLGGLTLNTSGFPSLKDCLKREFSEFYSTFQVGALWAELYRQGSSLQEGFLGFWAAVAKHLKDQPQLLAFELLNEPSGTCLGARTALGCLTTGEAQPVRFNNDVEANKLMPLYRAAAREIRSAGAKQIILYEATVWPKLGAPLFPEPALGSEPEQGLAYHIYCQPGDGDGIAAGLVCKAAQTIFENTYYPFLQAHKQVAGFMTEFGAVGGNTGELKHLDSLLAAADAHFQSWAYWQLKKYKDFTTANAAESLYRDDGTVEIAKLKSLSRTYAPAIGGVPSRMTFDPATAAFDLEFVATVHNSPTEIYLNEELHYPNGYSLEVTPDKCMDVEKAENRIYLSLVSTSDCAGRAFKVRVTATTDRETIV